MNQSKASKAALATQLVAGLKKHFSTVGTLTVGSGTFTPDQIASSLQTIADLRAAVETAKTATKAKVTAERNQAAPLESLMASFVAYVRACYANSPDVLADFGLQPKKERTPLTIDQQAAAVAKREATRAARHTMGKKQTFL